MGNQLTCVAGLLLYVKRLSVFQQEDYNQQLEGYIGSVQYLTRSNNIALRVYHGITIIRQFAAGNYVYMLKGFVAFVSIRMQTKCEHLDFADIALALYCKCLIDVSTLQTRCACFFFFNLKICPRDVSINACPCDLGSTNQGVNRRPQPTENLSTRDLYEGNRYLTMEEAAFMYMSCSSFVAACDIDMQFVS